MMRHIATLAGLLLPALANAATVTYDWTATWVNAAPDGFVRPVIGIDGQWPCPKIEASVGDTVVVKLTNHLGNQTTGIHFHGVSQVSTNFMDGPSMATQCPLPPNMTMTYQFTVGHSRFSSPRNKEKQKLTWTTGRPMPLAHFGGTRTTWGNTQMACAGS